VRGKIVVVVGVTHQQHMADSISKHENIIFNSPSCVRPTALQYLRESPTTGIDRCWINTIR